MLSHDDFSANGSGDSSYLQEPLESDRSPIQENVASSYFGTDLNDEDDSEDFLKAVEANILCMVEDCDENEIINMLKKKDF